MKPYYQDSAVTIYHGDCSEYLLALPIPDLLFLDPPYGVELKGKRTKHSQKAMGGYMSCMDTLENVGLAVNIVAAGLFKRCILTPGTRNAFMYPPPADIGAMFFPSGAGFGKWGFACSQPLFYYGPCPYNAARLGARPNSFSTTEAAEDNGHPCPKPIGVMSWLVKRGSLEGELVLDPFMGSGTTLRAAKDLGRKAIGIELEERYCEIAAKRMAQEVLAL
jgi:DNA modification methylase